MDHGKERIIQILADALDGLKLTEKNQELAKRYLALSSREEPALLEETEAQDFSRHSLLERKACLAWQKELQELAGAEEALLRYVRFTASVGGASAYYVLADQRKDMAVLTRGLSKVQLAALRAEAYAHEASSLQQGCLSVLYSMGDRDPEVLYDAVGLVRGADDAAGLLLSGAYLFCLNRSSREGAHKEEAAHWLSKRLFERLSELFEGGSLSDTEFESLRKFIQEESDDEFVPEELCTILKGKKSAELPFALFTGCAYLALGQAVCFEGFLRLAAYVDTESGSNRFLPLCRYLADSAWFYQHMDLLFQKMPISMGVWAGWSLRVRERSIWTAVAKRDPEAFRQEVYRPDLSEQERLMDEIRKVDLSLYQELERAFPPEQYRIKAAQELVTNYDVHAKEAEKYLLGEYSFEQIAPFAEEWQNMRRGYYGMKNERLLRLRDQAEHRQLYRRAVVLEGLLMHGIYFRHYMFAEPGEHRFPGELSARKIEAIFDLFEEEQVPPSYSLNVLSCIYEIGSYSNRSKSQEEAFGEEYVKALDHRIERWGAEYQKAALQGATITRIFCILAMDLHWQDYQEVLLSCAGDSSKQVRQVLLGVYRSHREWEDEILQMLQSKKLKERQMAVAVLSAWDIEPYREALQKALEQEKNAKLSESLKKLLDVGQEAYDLDHLAADCLKGSRRQKILWALTPPFGKIHLRSKGEAPDAYLHAILACYASMEVPGIHKDAVKLAAALQEAELSACMADLFYKWLDLGAEMKKKWVLYAVSIHGGEAVVPLLHQQIKELPAKSRGALAVEAVRALVLNGTSAALLLTDQISRKFPYRQIKRAAAQALDAAAEGLGISKEELEDRIIPDLGFDENAERMFDYGARKFTVRLSPALTLLVYGEDQKLRKSLPSPGRQDDPLKAQAAVSEFRILKRQMKTVMAGQKLRLEQALVTGRGWQADRWKSLFVKNPLMHPFALGVVWGVYEADVLKETFRYMEDGSFNTAVEEPYTVPENGLIKLVHPIELSEEEWRAWEEQLSDYEIVQPIEQLARPVYAPTEEELAQTTLTRYQGTVINALSLAGRLTGQGWYKGPTDDHGEYDTFYREDNGVGAELSFAGCGITCENTNTVVYDAVFFRTNTTSDQRRQRLLLGETAPRYFSEIVLQLARAVGLTK